VDYIGVHAHEHLHGRLSTDTAVHVRFSGKVFCQIPSVGNRITQENHPSLDGGRFFQPQVILMVAAQLVPVLECVDELGRRQRRATPRRRWIEILHKLRPRKKRQA
jgi:hypothetical protein